MPDIAKYLHKLAHLNRASTKFGKAPHKPVLLLTLLELIDRGHVCDNRFAPDTELVGIFQENWRLLVTTANQPDFTQPYYYLQSEKVDNEPIWKLVAQPGCQVNAHISSINTLVRVVDYGCICEPLHFFLADPVNRAGLRRLLLETYFPEKASAFTLRKEQQEGFFHDLEAWVLNVPEVRKRTIKIETEEDIYVRSGLFRRLVPQVYEQTCCVTGMHLGSTFGHSFIDACHIVPFSVSHDDRVTNGLALCPNIHRAFDRGLVTIDDSFRVLLSSHIREDTDHTYSLKRFDHQEIKLPQNKYAWPDLAMLRWHRKHLFRN